MSLKLVCQRVQQLSGCLAGQDSSQTLHEQTLAALDGHEAQAGESLDQRFCFHLPSGYPPSTPSEERSSARVKWELALRTKVRGWLAHLAKFTLSVQEGLGIDPGEACTQ
jgi:hypothetical protein